MKERPILFSGPMVRAILEGRKTQTRRIVDPIFQKAVSVMTTIPHKYGGPGDRLWLRETWAYCIVGPEERGSPILYRADNFEYYEKLRWKPSIFMPRWACRILLEIEGIKVERLQDISDEDAKAEGSYLDRCDCMPRRNDRRPLDAAFKLQECHIHGKEFQYLWDSINGKAPGKDWTSNPWVWVITFKPISVHTDERQGDPNNALTPHSVPEPQPKGEV